LLVVRQFEAVLNGREELTGKMSEKVLRNGANHGFLVPEATQPGTPGALGWKWVQKDSDRRQIGIYWFAAERQNGNSRLNLIMGILLGFRFLFFYLTDHGNGHIQSLLLCVIFVIIAFILFSLAVLGELAAVNRKLLERIESQINAPEVI
jgi:hypothetical protein